MGERIRRNIVLGADEERVLLAAVAADHGANFSHWIVAQGLRRARELDIPGAGRGPEIRPVGRKPTPKPRAAPRARAPRTKRPGP